MLTIFKWFFGIVISIFLIYVVIVLLRAVVSTGTSTLTGTATTTQAQDVIASGTQTAVNAVTGFSFANWFKGFQNSQYTPGYVIATNDTGGNYRNPLADKILARYAGTFDFNSVNNDDFDTRWKSTNNYSGTVDNNNTNNKNLNVLNSASSGNIKINLVDNSVVRNYEVISGSAQTQVFNNRTFPIYILDENKKILGTVKAFVNGSIRKDGTVPFRAVLSFAQPETNTGYLILKDQKDILKVSFYTNSEVLINKMPSLIFPTQKIYNSNSNLNDRCVITGCSMQLCLDQVEAKNLVTTCEYRQEYACYQRAVCERNSQSGRCGWKVDNTLARCLENSY